VSSRPEVTVVVASHARPLRLLWLLNALEEQTLAAGRFDVVVVHDYDAATAARIIDGHPLARDGRLHQRAIAPGTGSPAVQRNLAWRAATGALIAFTDDDCRPAADWLEQLTAAAAGRDDAFVQGTTEMDPYESAVLHAPHVRTIHVDPPTLGAETCNMLYPRALLERLGGFDERAVTGEDMDLAFRARDAGAPHLAAPDAVVFHAVKEITLVGYVRSGLKWRYMPLQAKLHPRVRRRMPLGLFWMPEHALVTLAATGALAARRRPLAIALIIPWLTAGYRHGGRPDRRGPLLHLLETPGRTVREMAEIATFAWGSVRYRTVAL